MWDASIQVGTNGTISKRINMGGDPTNGDRLIYSCSPVMLTGENGSIGGTIFANNTPYIVASPSVSRNDDYYGYSTTLSLTAYSIDGHTPLVFAWFDGVTPLGAGVNGAASTTNHTWAGNDKTVTAAYATQENHLVLTVNTDRDISCVVTDSVGATTTVDFRLRGKVVSQLGGVLVADTNAATTDATSQPKQRIGPGRTVTFVAYVKDIDDKVPNFEWSLPATTPGNWSVTYFGHGTNAAGIWENGTLPDGSFSCPLVQHVDLEQVSVGTIKTCVATCRISGTDPDSRSYGQTTELQFTVELVKNQAPTSTTVACTDINGVAISMTTGHVTTGDKIIYSAVSTDPDFDVVDQHWTFSNSANALYPNPVQRFGPKVVYDTTGMTSGTKIAGTIISTDRMGATITLSFSGPEIS